MRNRGNRVRIIAGQWRGRWLEFPDAAGLRPTPDRVRETLFNWLTPALPGAHCLDLFAGSGALGIEALSRGAASLTLVERNRSVAATLKESMAKIGAQAELRNEDALAFLAGAPRRFDLIFLDPPFQLGLMPQLLARLPQWVTPGALIYLEQPSAAPSPQLPEGWSYQRSKSAGEVGYHLIRVDQGSGGAA